MADAVLECGCKEKCICPVACEHPEFRSNGETCLISVSMLEQLKQELQVTACVLCDASPIALICPECHSGPCAECIDREFTDSCAREEMGEDHDTYMLCRCYDLVKERPIQ